MTMEDLNIAVKAYKDREAKEQQEQVYQAYLTSRWVWQKEINIKKVLKDMEEPGKMEPMTDEQMLAKVKTLNTMLGGEKACKS